ncbi:hypothetical protein LJR231_005919 [Phyllobacterium sp. LjRoot231]|uniref:hypothetical protein n=1 Tax=Phyllobacterium sp. LjRoot231 TaxID=3342289 RepID=UPI003ECC4E15
MKHKRFVMMIAIGAAAGAAPVMAQSSNPMWASGYLWVCKATSNTVCERGGKCDSIEAATDGFQLDYENSSVVFPTGPVKIKRHYKQTVVDSPLQAEVKIELADNRVLWLTPVDASRTYSQTWTGAMIEPKAGVVLTVTQSVYCSPADKK